MRTEPNTMAARRARIRALITAGGVHTQEDLRQALHREGFSVTQATVSRDLLSIGAVRTVDGTGAVGYLLPEMINDGASELPVARKNSVHQIAHEVLVSAEAAGNIVVLRTPPGGAQYLAGALDRSGLSDIVGTVAGDDTVMIVVRTPAKATALASALLSGAEVPQAKGATSGQRGS